MFSEFHRYAIARTAAVALLGLAASVLAAPSPDPSARLQPHCDGPFRLCGYIDRESGIQRIPLRFEIAQDFSEGLAAVRIDGRFGYIDRSGRLVIPARYRAAGPFLHGYAEVRTARGSGIINRAGRFAIHPIFDRIMPFGVDSFIAKPRSTRSAPNDVRDGSLSGFSDPGVYEQSDAGLYHIGKGWLTARNLTFTRFDTPDRGLAWAAVNDRVTGKKWGLIRADGSWQVRPRYRHVQSLERVLAVVSGVPDGQTHRGRSDDDHVRWGAVDRNGILTIPLRYEHLNWWGRYGIAAKGWATNRDGTPGNRTEAIVRPDGTLLVDRYFDKVDFPWPGMLPRGRIGHRWYSISPDGALLPDQLDGPILKQCPGGLTVIRRGDFNEIRHGKPGRLIGRFDHGYGALHCNGPITVRRGNRGNFVTQDGRLLGGQHGFEDQFGFGGSFAPVKTDGKWGIIDLHGRFTAPPVFARLTPEKTGIYRVGDGDAAHWIDAHGKPASRPLPRRPNPKLASTCLGGLRFFERHGLWGFENGEGDVVIGPRYRALSCFEQGVSWAAGPYGSAWCPIGPDGSRVAALGCRETFYPITVYHSAPEFFDEDPYENSVLWTRALLDYAAGKRAEPPNWSSEHRPPPSFLKRWGFRVLIGGSIAILLAAAWLYRRRRSNPEARSFQHTR